MSTKEELHEQWNKINLRILELDKEIKDIFDEVSSDRGIVLSKPTLEKLMPLFAEEESLHKKHHEIMKQLVALP